jgi:hypothetical protein
MVLATHWINEVQSRTSTEDCLLPGKGGSGDPVEIPGSNPSGISRATGISSRSKSRSLARQKRRRSQIRPRKSAWCNILRVTPKHLWSVSSRSGPVRRIRRIRRLRAKTGRVTRPRRRLTIAGRRPPRSSAARWAIVLDPLTFPPAATTQARHEIVFSPSFSMLLNGDKSSRELKVRPTIGAFEW